MVSLWMSLLLLLLLFLLLLTGNVVSELGLVDFHVPKQNQRPHEKDENGVKEHAFRDLDPESSFGGGIRSVSDTEFQQRIQMVAGAVAAIGTAGHIGGTGLAQPSSRTAVQHRTGFFRMMTNHCASA